jgi:2,3-diketo-5-methylthio-1-phosphopentane phosphatase
MAPSATTPPAVVVKSVDGISRPGMQRVDTSNIGTKRKIICFSGKRAYLADSGVTLDYHRSSVLTAIFSDFDGTIFMQDTGHTLFDNFGCGPERRAVLAAQLESGERSFREVSDDLYASLDVPFEDGFEVMKTALDIDPDFKAFHEFCINNNIPFNVISAGLKPVLRRVLDHFLGEEASKHIEIVANDADISADGSEWKAVWRHDTDLGHDKALSITEYREDARMKSDNGTIPMIVFIGDGVSDLPAARGSRCPLCPPRAPRRGILPREQACPHPLRHLRRHPARGYQDRQGRR